MKKSFGDGSPQVSMKQCQILKRTMRTLLWDLAQKSLKGLGTKAWTNWGDRSANSLAYQVSNHCNFLYPGCVSGPSSHRMRPFFFTTSKDAVLPSHLGLDTPSTDTLYQNMHGKMILSWKTPLILLMMPTINLPYQRMTYLLCWWPPWQRQYPRCQTVWKLSDAFVWQTAAKTVFYACEGVLFLKTIFFTL